MNLHLPWRILLLPLRRYVKLILIFFAFAGTTVYALSQASELTSPELWKPAQVPFSFSYDGKKSAQLLPTWQTSEESVADDKGQIHRYTYTDPATHLTVIADVRLYPDFPGVIDWVLRFRNEGASDTPILENILPLDWAIPAAAGDCLIRHAQGSNGAATDFTPLEESFDRGGSDHLESNSGRSSDTNTLPFFNLQTGDHGLVGAIGWTGDWKADFTYAEDGKTILMASGMKKTHLLLHPGEEIRTPRIVLMSWTGGNWQESQNVWRRLLFAHYTPQVNGHALRGPVLFGSWGSEPIADKLAYIKWVHDNRIPMDVYAVDAGWYGNSVGLENDPTNPEWNPWWKNRGDWYPSHRYYPHGIKPLGDALKADGIGFSLWIEPETAMPGTKITRDHPDWFVRRVPPSKHEALETNLGNPAALKGITDMVSNFITEFGITWYRQDSNERLEPYWKTADTPDRVGMAEIGHIEGLYKMWDDLLARHPGLRIDNCASGGRRLDIEMMSRSFSIWRTDHGFADTLAEQAQTQALAPWVPENMGFETYSSGEVKNAPWTKPGPYSTPESLYLMRLGYSAGYGVTPGTAGVNNAAWVAWIKQAIGEYREAQPYFYGDFYPLLPYSLSDTTWTAWQWNRPEYKDGLVIVLRRPKSPFTSMELDLQHLNPDASYEVEIRTTYEKTPLKQLKGSDLAHLQIQLPDAPSSTLIFYQQI
ncbi:MAG: alpha-galactosidase [Acidobacteriaceae bacterium]